MSRFAIAFDHFDPTDLSMSRTAVEGLIKFWGDPLLWTDVQRRYSLQLLCLVNVVAPPSWFLFLCSLLELLALWPTEPAAATPARPAVPTPQGSMAPPATAAGPKPVSKAKPVPTPAHLPATAATATHPAAPAYTSPPDATPSSRVKRAATSLKTGTGGETPASATASASTPSTSSSVPPVAAATIPTGVTGDVIFTHSEACKKGGSAAQTMALTINAKTSKDLAGTLLYSGLLCKCFCSACRDRVDLRWIHMFCLLCSPVAIITGVMTFVKEHLRIVDTKIAGDAFSGLVKTVSQRLSNNTDPLGTVLKSQFITMLQSKVKANPQFLQNFVDDDDDEAALFTKDELKAFLLTLFADGLTTHLMWYCVSRVSECGVPLRAGDFVSPGTFF